MPYAIKTPDGLGIFTIVNEELPDGVDPSRVWPVDIQPPDDGFFQSGITLDKGVVVAVYQPIPADTLAAQAQQEVIQAQIVQDKSQLPLILKLTAVIQANADKGDAVSAAVLILLNNLQRTLLPDTVGKPIDSLVSVASIKP